ncbi:MAG TPA: hydrogenase maturation protease [Gemmatimonadaceae bacterium]
MSDPNVFARAEAVANAVLYEGYVLYPYRASATKNQLRWQFGIVAPSGFGDEGGTEPSSMQTECLVDNPLDAVLAIRVRWLQAQARTIEVVDPSGFRRVPSLDVDGRPLVTWDEGIERQIDLPELHVGELFQQPLTFRLWVADGREEELVHDASGALAGRIMRTRAPLEGRVRVSAEPLGSAARVRVRIENTSAWPPPVPDGIADRDAAMRRSLLGTHTLLALRGGEFISLLEPPEWAKAAAASCVNEHSWPVLIGAAGETRLMLSSPIILYDYPNTAPESAGDLCDATEIDEILMLRVMTLSDAEKREACATDERARQIIERSDTIPDELFARLHGAVRSLEPAQERWVDVAGTRITRGSRVRLHPRAGADAMDMFLDGRVARVEAVHRDFDDATHIAVTVEDDPAADMHEWYGRYFYYGPDEVEPITPPGRVLVAGIGNIFNADDGFGVEVARRLSERTLPASVKVEDFGIRGMHLAYEMLDGGYATTILVDASPRGQAPGTVYLIEPDLTATPSSGPAIADAHGMHPAVVFQLLATLGGVPGHVLIVGCEPSSIDEEMGLSDPVARAVDEAVELIAELVAHPETIATRYPHLQSGT